MSLETFLFIANIQTFLFAVGILLSFVKYKSRQNYIVLLGFALVTSVFCDLLSYYLRGITSPNYGGSAYRIIVFPIVTAIYYHAVGQRKRNTFISIVVLFELFAFINLLFIQRSSINSYTLIIQSIIFICYTIYYFYWLLSELPTSQLHRLPMFWINSAYIIYFSGNLFLFVFTSYLVNVLNNDLSVYWTLHNVLGIIEGLMIIVALWMDLQNIKSLS